MSWVSVDSGDAEEAELRDTELGVGDKRLEFFCGGGATAGESDLPLPSTLPPPSFLADILVDH